MAESKHTAVVLNVDDDEVARRLVTPLAAARRLRRAGSRRTAGRPSPRPAPRDRMRLSSTCTCRGWTAIRWPQQLKADPATADIPILHLSASARDAVLHHGRGWRPARTPISPIPSRPTCLLATVGRWCDAAGSARGAAAGQPKPKRVTRRLQQAQRELEEQRALQEAILNQMPAAVMIADAETGRIYRMNPQASQLTGRSAEVGIEVGHYPGMRGFWPDGTEFAPDDWQSLPGAPHRASRAGRATGPGASGRLPRRPYSPAPPLSEMPRVT